MDVAIKIVRDNLPKIKESEEIEKREEVYEPAVLPETQEVKEIEEKPVKESKPSSLELELLDIKKKLEKLQA